MKIYKTHNLHNVLLFNGEKTMKKLDILHIHKHKRKNLCYNTIDRRGKPKSFPCLPKEKMTYSYRKEEHYGKAG